MNNISLKPKNPKKVREEQHNLYLEEEKLLCLEKAHLGYANIDLKDFLEIKPDIKVDPISASQVIALQERLRSLQESWALLGVEDAVVKELNLKHAVVLLDQTYILTEKLDLFGRNSFTLESKQSFKNFYENKLVLCYDNKERSKADIWLKSEFRREFPNGITFNPKFIEHINGAYNIWKGFTKEPKEGDCSKYWAHLKDNVCSGNEAHYQYVRKWLACLLQKPDEVHTALVLCGSQGVGKNRLVDPLGELLGQHYAPLGSISELLSNFKFHLKNAVLIHANEAFWGGHKREIGALKTMITEKTCLIESKGKDRIEVRNYKHVIMSSNEDWPVNLDPDDRRFFVLTVSDAHKEDHAYFDALTEQLNSGGLEALLYDLLNEPITGFNPRKFPDNENSFEIKLRSANPSFIYIFEALREGTFSVGQSHDPDFINQAGVWQPEIPKQHMFQDYQNWCRDNGYPFIPSNIFGKNLIKAIPSISEKRRGTGPMRTRVYVLPDCETARKEFCELFKLNESIWDEEI